MLAVSSSPRPLTDLFALPEKIKVFQHGGDWERSRPQGSKNVHTFLMTLRPLSWACGHGTEMLLILKKLFLTRLFPDIFRHDSPICGWNLFQPLGLAHCWTLLCEAQWRHLKPFWMGNRWKQGYVRSPPPYFIVSASSVKTKEVKAIKFHRILWNSLALTCNVLT